MKQEQHVRRYKSGKIVLVNKGRIKQFIRGYAQHPSNPVSNEFVKEMNQMGLKTSKKEVAKILKDKSKILFTPKKKRFDDEDDMALLMEFRQKHEDLWNKFISSKKGMKREEDDIELMEFRQQIEDKWDKFIKNKEVNQR